MAFLPFSVQNWRRGSVLVSSSDMIPDDALRRAVNVRLDRELGIITARPGWRERTSAAFALAVIYLSRLYAAATYSYAQFGTTLQRLNTSWAAPATINASTGSQALSDANIPDGDGTLHKYFVNGTIAIKDDGTTATTIGIAAPTAAPTSAALAPDLTTEIDQMDNAALWTGASLAVGPTDSSAGDFIFIEPPSAVTFQIAASTFGSIARFQAGVIDLDILTGGDALVKNDDYIHLWVRCDRPERVTFVQVDIDVDSATTGVADSFRNNYYHIRLGALVELDQGNGSWTQLQIRKARFVRFGTDTTRTWAHARGFRVGFLTNALGTVTFHVDDWKLRGGVGIEGDIEYTVCYRNSGTFARGNPPLNADRVIRATAKITTNRQRINLTTTNVREGGANHPGDAQIDRLMVWRKGSAFLNYVLVATINDTTASPFLDNFSDATLALTNQLLETDNDVPPTGTTRVLFGPGAQGHLFMIVDGYRLYFSKGYERLENRAENWGFRNFAIVGDGSARAVAGIATATQVRVWTTERTYQIVGVGTDTFLPVPIEGSRGAVGQFAITEGQGVLFFVSQDGIYADAGGRQVKLTGAIDPFFEGRTIDGQVGWNTAQTSLVRLGFLNEATGAVLVMLYAEPGSSSLNRFLALKSGAQNGQPTEAFFGTSALTDIRALFFDSINRELLAGGSNGRVYRIEDPATYSDAGTAIAVTARTKSYDIGQPQRGKHIAHALAEGQTTSQNLTFRAYYDRNATTELLSYTVNTSTETEIEILQTASPTTRRRDIALELTGSVSSRIAITRLGFFYEPQPEEQEFLDSGVISFDFVQQLKRFEIDIDLLANSTLTVYAERTPVFQGQLLTVTGRQNRPFPLPPGLRGRVWRVTLLTGGAPFLCYHWSGFFRQLGTDQQYIERVLVQGV